MVAEKQKAQVATSTFVIPLFDGKIKGKSKVNLDQFVDSLDSNLQKALIKRAIAKIGLLLEISDGEAVVYVENQKLLQDYISWVSEKKVFSKSLKNKTAVAEQL